MKGMDVRCPACGTMNKSLFLEETGGTYECERCGFCGTVEGFSRRILITRTRDIKKENEGIVTNGERLTPLTV